MERSYLPLKNDVNKWREFAEFFFKGLAKFDSPAAFDLDFADFAALFQNFYGNRRLSRVSPKNFFELNDMTKSQLICIEMKGERFLGRLRNGWSCFFRVFCSALGHLRLQFGPVISRIARFDHFIRYPLQLF